MLICMSDLIEAGEPTARPHAAARGRTPGAGGWRQNNLDALYKPKLTGNKTVSRLQRNAQGNEKSLEHKRVCC